MSGWSLRTKILIASSGTLLALLVATLAYVGWQANAFVAKRIADDLQGSTAVIAGLDAAVTCLGSSDHRLLENGARRVSF